jgi:hypothetical protein
LEVPGDKGGLTGKCNCNSNGNGNGNGNSNSNSNGNSNNNSNSNSNNNSNSNSNRTGESYQWLRCQVRVYYARTYLRGREATACATNANRRVPTS